MSWNGIHTWTVGERLTAANMNLYVSDNTFDLDRRTSVYQDNVFAVETTTSTTYTNLTTPGPAVSVEVGSTGKVLLGMYAAYSNASGNFALMSYAISGATTIAASDFTSLQTAATSDIRNGASFVQGGLNPGLNTFTTEYRCTAGTASFNGRFIWVCPLGS